MHTEPAGDDDLDACETVWLAALAARDGHEPAAGTAERFRAKARAPRVALRALREASGDGGADPRLLGFGLVTAPGTGYPTDRPDAAYLALLAVDPAEQGRGGGGRLLDDLTDDARAAGHDRLVLHVLQENGGAVALYRSRGWAPWGPPLAHALTGQATQTFVLGA
jgi:ribosomal protein S18 acetylase RimI-like enzyme